MGQVNNSKVEKEKVNIANSDMDSELKCHGASCLQANDAEGRKTIDWGRKEGERRKGLTRANTAIYSNKEGALA